jgi:acyl carrier protein
MDTKQVVVDVLSDQLGVEKNKIKDDSKIADDLGADSLDTVEVVQVLEDKFGIDIPDGDVVNIKTVNDIVAYVKSKAK